MYNKYEKCIKAPSILLHGQTYRWLHSQMKNMIPIQFPLLWIRDLIKCKVLDKKKQQNKKLPSLNKVHIPTVTPKQKLHSSEYLPNSLKSKKKTRLI